MILNSIIFTTNNTSQSHKVINEIRMNNKGYRDAFKLLLPVLIHNNCGNILIAIVKKCAWLTTNYNKNQSSALLHWFEFWNYKIVSKNYRFIITISRNKFCMRWKISHQINQWCRNTSYITWAYETLCSTSLLLKPVSSWCHIRTFLYQDD